MERNSNMAKTSKVLGIIGLVGSCACCMGLPFSVIAVMFGLLSKTEAEFEPDAKLGVILGTVGIVLDMILLPIAILMISMR